MTPRHVAAGGGSRAGIMGTIRAATSTGRQGAYYLPSGHEFRPLPMLVFLHGSGGKGSTVILRLRTIAERETFIAVAPDSVSVAGTWLVGQSPARATQDYQHVMECVREVVALPGVRVDRARALIAGFSVGGGAAAFLASHEDFFGAFAVLHGHVTLDDLGPRRVRGWLSTGDHDHVRTVVQITTVADVLKQRRGFFEIETRTFPGDHMLGEQELASLVKWWLQR
jgi:poly(3-hydroxybutyrate) depolymerase